MRWSRQYPERGSATVLSVGAVLLLVSCLAALLLLGAAVTGSLRARAAADAAALAGAGVLLQGHGVDAACGTAADLAAANGAHLLNCSAPSSGPGPALRVEVAVAVPALGGAQARAVAHAGAVPGPDDS